nr:hypothetical protein [Leucobacter weissii]
MLAAFRGRPIAVVRRVLLGLVAVVGAVALAWLPRWFSDDPGDRAAIDVVLASGVLLLAVLVPFFANRGHLEPRQFAGLPERPGSVALALLVTTVLSWPVLWMLVWLVSLWLFRPEWMASPWPPALACLLMLLLAVTGARLASGLSRLVVPRHQSGALRASGVIVLIAALPVAVFSVAQALRDPHGTMTADAAEILAWSPFGAPVFGVFLHETDAAAAYLRFAIALGSVLLLGLLWFLLVRVSLSTVAKPIESGAARHGLGWFERVPARPASVIGARSLTYWARDPRYRVALAAIPLAPVVMLLAFWVAGVGFEALVLLPLPVMLLLLGWSVHNDVALDSTAIWMHVASGTKGRHDRIGRLFPVLMIGLPLVLIGSSLTVTLVGDWRMLPAVAGMNLAILLSASGSSSVFSALMPYPTTRPGDSPFAQPAVVGSGSGAAQTFSMLLAALLAVPPVWVAFPALIDPGFAENMFALVFGVAYGVVVLAVCTLIGGRIFRRAGPELVALTQTFD